MTLPEFNALTFEEQIAVAMQGSLMDVWLEGRHKVAVFRHPYFVAEVIYDGTGDRIVSCRACYFNLNLAVAGRSLYSQFTGQKASEHSPPGLSTVREDGRLRRQGKHYF